MSNSGRDAVRKAELQRSAGRNGAVSTKGGAVATRARGWWKKFTKKRWTHFATLVRGVGDALNAQSPGNCPIEVFISCGIDVKHRFADLLYQSLRQRGITAFLDMEVFPDRYYRCASMRGTRDKIALLEMDDLCPSTRKAIQEAFIHVPIFTNKYLASISCLNELVEMMKRTRSDAKVFPVFYDVESQQLRKITSSTEDWVKAIHKENQHMARILGIKVGKFNDYSHEISIDRWREAIHDASRLEELPLESYGKSEAKLLRDLEEKIVGELQARSMLEWEQGDQRSFVGLKERVRNYAYEKMYPSGREVKFVVLWGMSGIGKTTLARAIFKKVGSRFEGRRCFVENCGDKEPSQILSEVANEFLELEVSAKNLPGVEGEGERLKGEKQKFQAEIVGQIRRPPAQMLHEKGEKSRRDEKGKGPDPYSKPQMPDKKQRPVVLIILDDVKNSRQLQLLGQCLHAFAVKKNLSLSVVITSEHDHSQEITNDWDIEYHAIKCMDCKDSLELFCLHAFKKPFPMLGFEELAMRVSNACCGVPGVLVMVGRHLNMRMEKQFWEEAIEMLGSCSKHEDIASLFHD